MSNPPYVNARLMRRLPREIRDHEPLNALAGGRDGLAAAGRLLSQAAACLEPGGLLAVEIGAEQRRGILALLARGPWSGARVERDLAGRARYALAERKNTQ
jgi:release factor glutamine methyltransferase